MWNLTKMNITKQTQSTSWWLRVRKGKGLGQDTGVDAEAQTTMNKGKTLQGDIRQHKEYDQF